MSQCERSPQTQPQQQLRMWNKWCWVPPSQKTKMLSQRSSFILQEEKTLSLSSFYYMFGKSWADKFENLEISHIKVIFITHSYIFEVYPRLNLLYEVNSHFIVNRQNYCKNNFVISRFLGRPQTQSEDSTINMLGTSS